MARTTYSTLSCHSKRYWLLVISLVAVVINGLLFARYMEHEGHWVTGMTNQVVWGVPHVFAIFLIVTASGVLNIASISSVFNREEYKVWARLSGLLAISLLVGGLAVLVLDLGRPDRLIVAITHYNLESIFAWNIYLYTGFMLIVIAYLWLLFEPRLNHYVRKVGVLAFAWRLILTTGTGSIFGILIGRSSYDTLLMAPLFIAMSLSFGCAFFIVYTSVFNGDKAFEVKPGLQLRLKKLLGYFVIAALLMTVIFYIVKWLNPESKEFVLFVLMEGDIYMALFWYGYMFTGTIVPLLILNISTYSVALQLVLSSILVIVGGFAQLYVIIIGGQAYPLDLFPGMEESSSFYDGVVANYSPSLPEISLGLGGVALAVIISLLVMRVLPLLPKEPSISTKA